jgi:hypothetical protein
MLSQNKSLTKILMLSFLMSALLNLVACPSPSPSNLGPQPCTTPNCQGIVPFVPNQPFGFYAQNSNMDYYRPNAGSTLNTNPTQLTRVLRDFMGVCDREHSNGGLANCQSWLTGFHRIEFQTSSSLSNMISFAIASYPQINPNFYFYYQLPSFSEFFAGLGGYPIGNPAGIFNPMFLTMTVNPINNSKGFELRSYGPRFSFASGTLLQLVVPNGKFEDPAFDYAIFVNNIPAATAFDLSQAAAYGRMVRCTTQPCYR